MRCDVKEAIYNCAEKRVSILSEYILIQNKVETEICSALLCCLDQLTDKNIMVLCDEQVEESLKICIYDSESFSFDDMEYKEEII